MKRLIFSTFIFLVSFSAFGQELNQTDKNGLKQGKWKKLYKNGRVRYTGQFKDDKPVDLFQYYYENGELKATNNHIGDGTVAHHAYHKNGKIKAKGMFLEQLKDSLWQYFNENEVLILEETYRHDTLDGSQKTYYENAQLAEQQDWKMGVKHGPWFKFFEGGEPWVEAGYEEGNLHGKFVMYRDKNKRDMQGAYHQGIRTGTWMFFNDNGSVKEQQVYRHGSLQRTIPQNGEFTEYYSNDVPKSVYNYKRGKKQGEFKEFYEVGEWVRVEKTPSKPGEETEMIEELRGTQLKVRGWYNNDQLNGKVTHYNQDGSVNKVEVWEDGVLVSTIDWEAKGNE
jgi:antitoxin component YwqK of YwqJK toxin-antitoxin module